MNTVRTTAVSLVLFLLLTGCEEPPPPPPPPPPTDAGGTDAGVDGGSVDAGRIDGGADPGVDGGPPPSDAGPPPPSGPFADLVVEGEHTGSYRIVPPANTLRCQEAGADDAFIGLSVHPGSTDRDALVIDVFGPLVVGSYMPLTGRERPGSFGMIYRVSVTETYLIDTGSTPCTFEVTTLSGGILEAAFDCRGLVNFAAPGEGVNVSGRLRCNFP